MQNIEDLSIRDVDSNLIYNKFTHDYFMKIHKDNYEEAKEYKNNVLTQIDITKRKYEVCGKEIICMHPEVFSKCAGAKYFNDFEEAKEHFSKNCLNSGMNKEEVNEKLLALTK
jgi:hypothetical protein